jgi:rhamnosyl/mannosyltransferase
MTLKILHVYKDYYPPVKGGIECHLNLLANGLMKNGIDVKVLISNTTNKYEQEVFNGIRILKAPQLGRFYSAPLTPSFHFYLHKLGKHADIIHFHHPNPTAEFSYFFTNLNKKMVVTYHSDIIRQDKLGRVYAPFRKFFLQLSDRIIATSPNYIETSNVLKYFKHKCTVIPLGIDIERFCQDGDQPEIDKIKEEYKNKYIILFVGCFRYYKGLEFLLQAIKEIPAKLLLIGAGPEEQKLRRIVKRNHLNKKVIFLGELPDKEVNIYYKACDIFVLPSHLRSEAFGIVQLEAMCCSKPVISTELGTGTSFVNQDQKTGIIVNPCDILSLTNAINHLLNHPKERLSFGAYGFKRVKQYFTAEKMIERTIELYHEVLEKGPKKIRGIRRPKRDKSELLRNRIIKDRSSLHKNLIELEVPTSVLHIITRLIVGGAQENTLYTAELLSSDFYDVDVLSGAQTGSEGSLIEDAEDRAIRLFIEPNLVREINPIKDLITFFNLVKFLKMKRYQIVHTHSSKAGILGRWAAWVAGVPTIIHTVHGWGFHDYQNRFIRFLFILMEKLSIVITDQLIVVTNEDIDKGIVEGIGSKSDYTLIRSGIDFNRFNTKDRNSVRIRKSLGLPPQAKVVGTITRLSPQKAPKVFIDAAALINKEHPDTFFVVVGDGPNRKQLEIMVNDLGIGNRVIFTGIRSDVHEVLHAFDLFMLTSLWEGLPRVIPQAMAAGIPVIASRVNGNAEIIQNNVNGILVQPGVPKDFAQAVISLIGDDNRARDLKNAALKIIDEYSVHTMVQQIDGLYRKIA